LTRRESQDGQALIFLALALPMLLGMVGLAFDIGFLEYVKRQAQTAADAGAIAGAADLFFGTCYASALAGTAANNFTNGANGVTVLVDGGSTCSTGPSSGPHAGNPNYVEVVVSQTAPTFFLKMVGAGSTTVAARAVASNGPGDCIFALDPTKSGALSINLSIINVPGCGVTVDSTSGSALSGFFAGITARSIAVTGGVSCFCFFTPTPVTGIAPASDPLSYLAKPAVAACAATANNITKNGAYTVNPAIACYNVTVTGTSLTDVTFMPGEYSSITISSVGSVTFNPGLYIIQGSGGISIGGVGGSYSGTGVTFYIGPAAGSVTFDDAAFNGLNLIAPPTGTYAGILFFQDPANTNPACFGGGGACATSSGILDFLNIQGSLYFPKAALNFGGCCQFAAYTIAVADSLSFEFDYFGDDYSSLPGGSPIKRTVLTE